MATTKKRKIRLVAVSSTFYWKLLVGGILVTSSVSLVLFLFHLTINERHYYHGGPQANNNTPVFVPDVLFHRRPGLHNNNNAAAAASRRVAFGMSHQEKEENDKSKSGGMKETNPNNKPQHQHQQQKQQQKEEPRSVVDGNNKKAPPDGDDDSRMTIASRVARRILRACDRTESEILDFFLGEPRALRDGVGYYSSNDETNVRNATTTDESNTTGSVFAERLAHRIQKCAAVAARASAAMDGSSGASPDGCVLRVVFIGSAQTSGRDNFYNRTYPFVVERLLAGVANAAGLRLEVLNHAMDNDLGREGPQTNHMCLQNLVGGGADVIGWDYEDVFAKNAQFESFVRWALLLSTTTPSSSSSSSQQQQQSPPALVLVNRGGPHGLSRRGISKYVVDISGGHRGIIFKDNNETSLPQQRTTPYKNSTEWKLQWHSDEKPNNFWSELFGHYASAIDFATIDPRGSIWHLDHTLAFSNAAFDGGKALPLVDCGKEAHPPPCDRVPPPILRNLQKINKTIRDLPDDTDGDLCGMVWGCRHSWYGGTKSHALRGQLNAAAVLRGFREAAQLLLPWNNYNNDNEHHHGGKPPSKEEDKEKGQHGQQLQDRKREERRDLALSSDQTTTKTLLLPPPLYCNPKFCSKAPRCVTSYEPNLSWKLSDAIRIDSSSSSSSQKQQRLLPQLGISQYRLDRTKTLQDVENLHFAPLGYIDRKHAYRLSRGDEDEASAVAVNFTTTSSEGGPLILCEPPCIVDTCPPKRKMPLIESVTIRIDGIVLPPLKKRRLHPSVEVGRYCFVLKNPMAPPPGVHTLRIETSAVFPEYVLFSHIISY